MNTYANLREAAINIVKNEEIFFGEDQTTREEWEKIHSLLNALKSALAESPRNCDVGTAEEQVERFKEYCQSNMQYYWDMFGTHEGAGGWDCKEECLIGKMIDKNEYLGDHCQLLWAQMPYESEVME